MRYLIPCLLLLTGCARYEISPLAAAARTGDTAAIRALAASGASLDAPAGINDWTPLMHAIHKNQPASVETLLALGADLNARAPHDVTALMLAAGYGYDGIVRILLQHGADPALKDVHGATAMDYAKKGVMDIDRFTWPREQTEAVAALTGASTAPRSRPSLPR